MAPRATQQSYGRRSGGPSQSQGSRNNRRANDSDEEEEEEEYDDDDQGTQRANNGGKSKSQKGAKQSGGATSLLSRDERTRRAYDLVRMAIFEEQKRGVLRRTDINKRIMGEYTRAFNYVFDEAQAILRKTFGLEMVELMTRTERDNLGNEKEGSKKKSGTATSKTYIVRSVLDPTIIQRATQPHSSFLQKELKDLVARGIAPDEASIPSSERPHGTLIAWKATESVALAGILQLVLCLILISERSLPEMQLKNQLRSFHIQFNTALSLPGQNVEGHPTLQTHLHTLIRQNYLDCVRVSLPGAAASQAAGRRKNRAADDDDPDTTYEWKWGSRAHAEISEKSVAEFMMNFMKDRWLQEARRRLEEEEELEATEAQNSRSRRKEDRNKRSLEERLADLESKAEKYSAMVYKDIERAAGGSLTEIKARKVVTEDVMEE
ncbi:hypothetical protein FRB99_004906 [Tulasnella sp. 403]|nr:hypothetical protein FRB99_004906 [Tulasnella sp. 403]